MNRILITGGTGSLGTSLVHRLYETHDITILSRNEENQAAMRKRFPKCKYILGNIENLRTLELAFRNIDIVYHFAAYKQVPSAQNNVQNTIDTNVIGSINVVYAALNCGVKQVVASSTDKACEAVNVYGASKQSMEAIFQDANKFGGTTFHLARYGNVVASNASVVPLFKRQAEQGGPLTVTHPDMTRFWISINTAVDLIQHALTVEPGIIVVPMAKAMSVIDVATTIGGSLPIEFVGIRAGEKMHESMVSHSEGYHSKVVDSPIDSLNNLVYIHPPTRHITMKDFSFVYNSLSAEKLTPEEFLDMVDDYEVSLR